MVDRADDVIDVRDSTDPGHDWVGDPDPFLLAEAASEDELAGIRRDLAELREWTSVHHDRSNL